MIELVGLDLDGTLVDSVPDLSDALGRALTSLQLPAPTENQTRTWVGDGIEALIERAVSAAAGRPATPSEVGRALTAFDAYYAGHHFTRSRVYPGVPDTLRALREAGLRAVCITNKRYAFARPMLAAAGLERYVDAVYGGDSCARSKPAPDQLIAALGDFGVAPDRAVMVGDSPNDMDAASAAGWRFVFASYGYTATMTARRLVPAVRIDRFAELAGLLLPD